MVQNLVVSRQCPFFGTPPILFIIFDNYSGHQDKTSFELACDKIHKILLLSGYYTIRIHVPGAQTTNTQDTGYEILFISSDYTCVDTPDIIA